MASPCDLLLAAAPARLYRAVSVQAPPALVFRWLCQLKLAPYSYDLLDNASAAAPGSSRPAPSAWWWASFARDEKLTLRGRRIAVAYATITDGARARLPARLLFAPSGPPPLAVLSGWGLALGDLVMMRRQLPTVKSLAERDSAGAVHGASKRS